MAAWSLGEVTGYHPEKKNHPHSQWQERETLKSQMKDATVRVEQTGS